MAAQHFFIATSAHQSGTANPSTTSVTVGNGATVLVAFVITSSATLRTGGAPSWNGLTMTQAGTTRQYATSPETSCEIWYLLNPPDGTANLSIPNAGGLTIRRCASTYYSTTGASELHQTGGGTGLGTNPTASITTTKDGCLLVSVMGGGQTTWAPSAQDGTALHNTDHGANAAAEQYLLQSSAGTQAMGWTEAESDDWNVAVAAFAPATSKNMPENYKSGKVADGISGNERIR